jgi:hypothetical protein
MMTLNVPIYKLKSRFSFKSANADFALKPYGSSRSHGYIGKTIVPHNRAVTIPMINIRTRIGVVFVVSML